MTIQVKNLVDAGIAYETLIKLLQKVHKVIRVVIKTKLWPSWKKDKEICTIMVSNEEEAKKVLNIICQNVGEKHETVKINY